MLWQHEAGRPIGRWMRLMETARGLWAEGELATGVLQAREAAHLIAAGALNGLSIDFKARQARRDPRSADRILRQIDLWEISLVTFPQVEDARAHLVVGQARRQRSNQTIQQFRETAI